MSGHTTQQDYIEQSVRTAAVLTNAFVAGTVLGTTPNTDHIEQENQLILFVDFTMGGLTSADILIEGSFNGTSFYKLTNKIFDAVTSTYAVVPVADRFTATDKYVLAYPIKYRFIRVSVIGNGNVAGSSMAITGVIGTV